MTTLVEDVVARIAALVPALAHRIEEVAQLAELVKRNALPQKSPFAFVLPLGFNGGEGEAVTGLYRQRWDRMVGVILYVEALGDAGARRALAKIDGLEIDVVNAIAGWGPDSAPGVFTANRGRLVSVNAGGVLYQIDFALQDQLRIAT